jgi:hypothetical protein
MTEALESIARVGLAGWVGASEPGWDAPPVLGMIGDELYLVEIDAASRELVLPEIIDRYNVDDPSLRIELVFFGDAGGFFASSLNFFGHWPKSLADVPADVFVDERYRAAFITSGDDVVMSVRHALRPSGGPPWRRFRFLPDKYEQAMAELARASRSLHADLIALAQARAPEKVESLRAACQLWPS